MKKLSPAWVLSQQRQMRLNKPDSYDAGFMIAEQRTNHYFKLLSIEKDLKRRSVIEVGGGNYPAITFCHNFKESIVIEPNVSPELVTSCGKHNGLISCAPIAAEECNFPKVDEVWLFNVLKFCIDPDQIMIQAKHAAKTVRFVEFEYQSFNDVLHRLTIESFERNFPNSVQESFAEPKQMKLFYGVYSTKP